VRVTSVGEEVGRLRGMVGSKNGLVEEELQVRRAAARRLQRAGDARRRFNQK
jgi:hypothetical protein